MDATKMGRRPPGLIARLAARWARGDAAPASEEPLGAANAQQGRPTLVALTPEEVAAFWGGGSLNIYTRAYLEALAEKNGMELVYE